MLCGQVAAKEEELVALAETLQASHCHVRHRQLAVALSSSFNRCRFRCRCRLGCPHAALARQETEAKATDAATQLLTAQLKATEGVGNSGLGWLESLVLSLSESQSRDRQMSDLCVRGVSLQVLHDVPCLTSPSDGAFKLWMEVERKDVEHVKMSARWKRTGCLGA